MFCNSRMACGLSSLMTSATAITPISLPPLLKYSGVLPDCARASAFSLKSAGTSACVEMNFRLPPARTSPFRAAVRPLPGFAMKSVTSFACTPISSARAMMALASGCSLFFSSALAASRRFFSVMPGAGKISVTRGSPLVMVPVLSSATICTLPVFSSETAVLNRMPFFAPMPLPTMMATGVARPSAHGQLMTSTEMPRASA